MRTNKQIISAVKSVKKVLDLGNRSEILSTPLDNRTIKQRQDMLAHAALDALVKTLEIMSVKDIMEKI